MFIRITSLFSQIYDVLEAFIKDDVYFSGEFDLFGDIVAQWYGGYLIFDITPWKAHLQHKTFSIHYKVRINNKFMTIHHHHEPVIVLYENLDHNPLFVQLKERARRDVWTYTTEYPPMDRDFLCRRYDWNIPMDLFQWNWYILPRQINAGMCGGECRFPLTGHFNATNYSFLKSWYHQATRHDYTELIPTACCTPFEYHPLSVMYITNLLEVRVKQMPEMRVASCACR